MSRVPPEERVQIKPLPRQCSICHRFEYEPCPDHTPAEQAAHDAASFKRPVHPDWFGGER